MAHRGRITHTRLMCGAAMLALLSSSGGVAAAQESAKFDIAPQALTSALNEFAVQSPIAILYTTQMTGGKTTAGVSGESNPELALNTLLAGTGLTYRRDGNTFLIVSANDPQSGSAAGDGADAGTVQALIVTAQKREENIQDVPIAMSAFTQEELTRSQVAGGPDLMTQVPNFTFTKTNFSSYSIQIRGIGTQAISATTDAAVAVAFNNTPFIRNRFFEQEFYDLERIEVLRGPQGTLYGRNATAGVVNIISAKPKFQYEAKLSADVANFNSARLEGMVNIPLVENKAALRLAGAWTKRDGYATNELTGNPIDGRDLWSTRLSLRVEPTDRVRANLIWEHFEENDDRLRSGKQLCKKDVPTEIGGVAVAADGGFAGSEASTYSQGCAPTSLYSPDAFQTPYGYALPYYGPLAQLGLPVYRERDPYVSATQSRDLRVIESTRDPKYRAKTDVAQILLQYDLTPNLTLASESSFSVDELFSTQDFNRFNTQPGAFVPNGDDRPGVLGADGVFCDPQLGCSDRLVLADLSTAKSRQFSEELRLSSDFDGPLNFSLGANFLRYDTEDRYYVFANSLTLWAASASWTLSRDPNDVAWDAARTPYIAGETDNSVCLKSRKPGNPNQINAVLPCIYIDPNPIDSVNGLGHNYFLSRNPYKLISYAAFGEAYYNLSEGLKFTTGFRWTVDKKKAPRIPSWLLVADTFGYPVTETVDQEWREPTGRLALDWKPDLSFTAQTLLYASYARGYKAGGMNPPPAVIADYAGLGSSEIAEGFLDSTILPKTFEAEFVNAYEIGSKNTLLDGKATFNINAFYYDYTGYQLSQIINRSAVTLNFDANVWGLEIESDWQPLENLRLGFKGGYENTRVADGEHAIDLMDRTAGHKDWVVARPFPTVPSNCILPVWFVTFGDRINVPNGSGGSPGPCILAYYAHVDPVTQAAYTPNPLYDRDGNPLSPLLWSGYPGFDPTTAPNNGEGFFTDLSGNELPNAPHFTATITADYTIPLPHDWLVNLHTDLYYQSEAWTRIFNMPGYDKLKAYSNINLAAIFTNEEAGWKVMAYVKNVLDRDSITGAFLNSDDTGLTTNVFLTEPRLYGLRVTKEWTGQGWWTGANPNHVGPYPFTVEVGGQVQRQDAPNTPIAPGFISQFSSALNPLPAQNRDLDWGDGREVKVTYRPGKGPWTLSAATRFGRTNNAHDFSAEEIGVTGYPSLPGDPTQLATLYNYALSTVREKEEHEIVDFSLGRDVGLGVSAVSLALRYAQFTSHTFAEISGIPDYYIAPQRAIKYPRTHTQYASSLTADRTFRGAGPVLSWDGSLPLIGDDEVGGVEADWSVSGGVLFGKQRASGSSTEDAAYSYSRNFPVSNFFSNRDALPGWRFSRSRSVAVPVAAVSFGLSYNVDRVKLSTGYRWERYFNAIDGGFTDHKSYDRTIDGPYFKVSVGFGG